jgi:DNA invertase Pin-like site-specific DNA recombinase
MSKAKRRFVAYYRVSTLKQGRSGLGIEAQRHAIAAYLNGGDWTIIAEFTEVESGRRASSLPPYVSLCRQPKYSRPCKDR